MTELEALRKRVDNLEYALHALWAFLQNLQPSDVQEAGNNVMQQHYEAAQALRRGEDPA